MKVVYVAGPFRAVNTDGSPDMFRVQQNIMNAMNVALSVWKAGAVAMCPHANTMFFTGASGIDDRVWLDGDLELLRRCDALILTPDWSRSSGAVAEKHFADQLQLPVFHFVSDLQQWLKEAA